MGTIGVNYNINEKSLNKNVQLLYNKLSAGHTTKEVEIDRRLKEIDKWMRFHRSKRIDRIIEFIALEILAIERMEVLINEKR